MWKAYEELQPYLKGLTLSDEQIATFKEKVDKWGKLYISTFGEEQVTHYNMPPGLWLNMEVS